MVRKKEAAKAAKKRAVEKGTSHPFAWNDAVTAVEARLQTLEGQVAQADFATPDLEGFKSALDELRLRAWGLLMAAHTGDPHGFQQRFRIRRGKDMCRALCDDLHGGKLSGRHPDLPELSAAAHDLATTVDDTRRQAEN